MDKSTWSKELWDIYYQGLSMRYSSNPYRDGSINWNVFEDGREHELPDEEKSAWKDRHGNPWKKEGSIY